MSEALEFMYQVYSKTMSFLFGSYLFTGVSIGMLFVCAGIFGIMLRFLVAIPRVRVGRTYSSISGADPDE